MAFRIGFGWALKSSPKRKRQRIANWFIRIRATCRRRFAAVLVASTAIASSPATAFSQLPSGGEVVAGSAAIMHSGTTTNISSHSDRAVINWQDFSVAHGASVNFAMPDATSAVLNRVISEGTPSIIAGAINSNGNVFLVNPSGVLVSPTGSINTNGFTASTFDIATQEFMKGGNLNLSGNSKASIVNQGTINTGAGGANLIANQIINEGTITSQGGSINLATGGRVTLSNGATYTQADIKTIANGISETAGLIKNDGTIRATGALEVGGKVYLVNPGGKIVNNGAIMANKEQLSSTVPSAPHAASQTIGGTVVLEADKIELKYGSNIDASGTHGGGEVLVGGDWQGSGDMTQATTVRMESGATIDASATNIGDGGKVVLWSDVKDRSSRTSAHGTIRATGGSNGGDGGRIETSSFKVDVKGLVANASSLLGNAGQWLLDPYNLNVVSSTTSASTNSGPPYEFNSAFNGTDVDAADIETQLNNGTSVVLQTTGTNDDEAGNGDITISADITKSAGGNASLTFKAHNIITSNNKIESTSGALNVIFNSDSDGNQLGDIAINGDVITNGGNIIAGGRGNPLTSAATGSSRYIGIAIDDGVTLSAGGGNISLTGRGNATTNSNAHGVALGTGSTLSTTGAGTITITGIGGGTTFENTGLALFGNASISTQNGAITLQGWGGGDSLSSGRNNNIGIGMIYSGASVTSSTGNIYLSGTGGRGELAPGIVVLNGVTFSTGGSGTIQMHGAGGVDDGELNTGIYMDANISSSSGAVLLSGTSLAQSGLNTQGVLLDGTSISTGGSSIVIIGTSNSTSGNGREGVQIDSASTLTTNSGGISITGTSAGGGSNAEDVSISGSLTTVDNVGAITITADSLFIDSDGGATDAAINSGSGAGLVNLHNRSAGRAIDVGAATSGSSLVIDNNALSRVFARAISIGNNSVASGDISIGAALNRSNAIDLTLQSGNDIHVDSNVSLQSTSSLNLLAQRHIFTASGVTVAGVGGTLDILFNANRSDSVGGIFINTNSILNSAGGSIRLGGGFDPTVGTATGGAGRQAGVEISSGAIVGAAGGNIVIRGSGEAAATSTTRGVLLQQGAIVQTLGNGTLSITGAGGGQESDHVGIALLNGSVVATQHGNLTLYGQGGGNNSNTNNSGGNQGIYSDAATIQTTGSGDILITGIGGSVTTSDANWSNSLLGQNSQGVKLDGTIATTGSGDITILGTGGIGRGDRFHGIDSTATIVSNSGDISLSGQISATTFFSQASILIESGGVQSTAGSISLEDLSDYSSQSSGVGILAPIEAFGTNKVVSIKANDLWLNTDSGDGGIGSVSVNNGTIWIQNKHSQVGMQIGGTYTSGIFYIGLDEMQNLVAPTLRFGNSTTHGIDISDNLDFVSNGALAQSVRNLEFVSNESINIGGNVSLQGASTFLAKSNENVLLSSNKSITLGSDAIGVTLHSDSDSSGGGMVAIGDSAAIHSGDGNIVIGGGTNPLTDAAQGNASSIAGVILGNGAQLTSDSGFISIRGQGYSGANSNADGVSMLTNISISTPGNISIYGTGGGTDNSNYGIRFGQNANIIGGTGTLTLQGVGGGYPFTGGSKSENIGIGSVLSDNNFLLQTSSGNINISGTGGAGADWLSIGSYFSGTIQTTTGGNINIVGVGGAGGGFMSSGVTLDGLVLANNGDITIDGTAGSGAGPSSFGVEIGSAVTSTSGSITIIGQGESDPTVNSVFGIKTNGVITANAAGEQINLRANSIHLQAAIVTSTTDGTVIIESKDGSVEMNIGGNDSASQLGINGAEVGQITATKLVFGTQAHHAGNINVNIPLVFGPSEALTSPVNTIELNSGGHIFFNQNITTAAAGALTARAYGNIELNGITFTSQSGAMNVTLNSDRDALLGGTVYLSGSQIVSNGGNVILGGGNNPGTTSAIGNSSRPEGVGITGSSINAGGGNISIRGQGYSNATYNAVGVNLYTSNQIATNGSGTIAIYGQGGGSAANNSGILIGNLIVISSLNGNILLNGTGGGSSGVAGAGNNFGIKFNDINSSITSTDGNVSLYGQGGSGDTGYVSGIDLLASNNITVTGAGNLSLEGIGGISDANNGGGDAYGIFLGNSISANTGNITDRGIGGVGSQFSGGIHLYSGSNITSDGNLITLIGGSNYLTGNNNQGIVLRGDVNASGGSSNIVLETDSLPYFNSDPHINANTVTLRPYTSGFDLDFGGQDSATQLGIDASKLSMIQATSLVLGSATTGNVFLSQDWDLTSFTNLTLLAGHNVYFNNNVTGLQDGNLIARANNSILLANNKTIDATSDKYMNVLFNSDWDASLEGAITIGNSSSINTRGGGISLSGGTDTTTGRAWGTAAQAEGVRINNGALLNAGGGNILIRGAGYGFSSQEGNGISLLNLSSIQTTGTGTITMNGLGGGADAGSNNNEGISIDHAAISNGTGLISWTGTGGGSGSAYGNNGISMRNNSSISSSGGDINLYGTRGNGNGNDEIGVLIDYDNLIETSGTGGIIVVGNGNNNSGDRHIGVRIAGSLANEHGNILVTGIASNASGNGNFGIDLEGSINTFDGNIFLEGRGGTAASNTEAIKLSGTSTISLQAGNFSSRIEMMADSLGIGSSSSINGNSGIVKIGNQSSNLDIDVGGSDVTGGGMPLLGISNAELQRINAWKLIIGSIDADSGDVTVSHSIAPTNSFFTLKSDRDLFINENVSMANAEQFTGIALRNIIVADNVSISSSASSLNILLNSNSIPSYLGTGGAIVIGDGASLLSNGGNITLGGDSDPSINPAFGTSQYKSGVLLGNDSTVNASGGNVSIRGYGYSNGSNGAHGVQLGTRSLVTTSGGGTIFVRGHGGGLDNFSSSNNYGTYLFNGAQIIGGSSGGVNVVGFGGGYDGNGDGTVNSGVVLSNPSSINTTRISSTGGNVSVTGTGGDGDSGNRGIDLDDQQTFIGATNSGEVTLMGYAGPGTANDSDAIRIRGTVSSESDDVTITGTTASNYGANTKGVFLDQTGVVSSSSGWIFVNGEGGTDAAGTRIDGAITSTNRGVVVSGQNKVGSTSVAGLEITGSISASDEVYLYADSIDISNTTSISSSNGSVGFRSRLGTQEIHVGGADVLGSTAHTLGISQSELNRITANDISFGINSQSARVSVTNNVDLSRFANVSLNSESDIEFNANVLGADNGNLLGRALGNISIANGVSLSANSGPLLVVLNSDRDISGGGAIVVGQNASILTQGGDILLGGGPYTSDASTSSGALKNGILLSTNAILNAGGGNIYILGKSVDSDLSNTTAGVMIDGATVTTSGNGVIIVFGESTATGTNAYGVGVINGGQILGGASSSGPYRVGVFGTGGAGTSNNIGVLVTGSNSIISTNGGTIRITGSGGSGDGAWNAGVLNVGAISASGTGNIEINGNGGSGNGNYAIGVANFGTIATANGSISLLGAASSGNGTNNHGIANDGNIASTGGSITLSGLGGIDSVNSEGISITGTVSTSAVNGVLSLNADSLNITSPGTVSATNGVVAISHLNTGTPMLVGDADVLGNGVHQLGISNAEIGRITANILRIGNTAFSSGGITVNGAINASQVSRLEFNSGGSILFNANVALSHAGNILAQSIGSLTIASGRQLTTSNGDIDLSTYRFVNNSGSNALNVGGSGKAWRVWSLNGDPFGSGTPDVAGGLNYSYKQYNASYGSVAPAETGNGLLYAIAPTIDVSFDGPVTKVYDGNRTATLNSSHFTISGLVDGDVLVLPNGTFDNPNAGTGKTVTIPTLSQVTNSGRSVYGYTFNQTNTDVSNGSISALGLTNIDNITGITASGKIYDGNRNATLDFANAVFVGILNGDVLTVATGIGLFDDKNVGSNKTVNISGLTLGGADAGNYVLLDDTATAIASISRATISAITGITASNKQYNASSAATLDVSGAGFTGKISGDSLTVATSAGSFTNKNAGNNKTVNITGLTLGGTDANNYMLSDSTASANASISQAAISAIDGLTANNRVYNGSTSAMLNSSSASFTGRIGSDILTLGGYTADFDNKNVGDSKTVTATGLLLGGIDAGNYSLSTTTGSFAANITPATINSITGLLANDKVYDGTTGATLTTSGANFVGKIGSDSLLVATANGSFSNKNAAIGKTVSVSGLSLGGADAGNYVLGSTTATTMANISRLSLNAVSGLSAVDKVYDSTRNATVDYSSAALSGVVGSDNVVVAGAAGLFSDKNVGTSKQVIINGITLSGTDAGNYSAGSLSQIDFADISQAFISQITGIRAFNKLYDESTNAALNWSTGVSVGKYAGDQLNVGSANGEFVDATPGYFKQVNITGLSLAGADAGNYILLQDFATTTAHISAFDELMNSIQKQLQFDQFTRHTPNASPSLSSSISTGSNSESLGSSNAIVAGAPIESVNGLGLVATIQNGLVTIDNEVNQPLKKPVYVGSEDAGSGEGIE